MSKASSVGKAVVTLLIIGGVGFGGWKLYKNYGSSAANSSDKVYVQKVSNVNTVTGSDLFANSFPGVVVAQKSVDVQYDSTKTIKDILVAEGDAVKKGDKLLTYDTEAIQIEIDTAKLEVERSQNEIETNNQQIKQYEEEKKNASEDQVVSYTNQILQLQSENARTEYDIKAKNVEITKLENSKKNAYVIAPIDGTVKDLKDPSSGGGEDDYRYSRYDTAEDVIMKLTAEGDFRVKGVFNEQNSDAIYKDAEVILRSRTDDTSVNGVVSEIDTTPQENNDDMYGYGESDEQTTSSKYAFYVEPESLEGFKLGQHILIDTDRGSDVEKTGIWLYSNFILKDGNKSYVWAKKSDKDVIEKRYIKIGKEDTEYGDCEILEGLSTDDYIAYPADYIKEGLATTTNSSDKDIPENELGGEDGEMMDGDMMDEGMMDEGMMDEGDMGGMPDDFVMNDDGSFTMTDENGNIIEGAADGSAIITSPDGGVAEVDSEGNFIRGSMDDEGNYTFDYSGEAAVDVDNGKGKASDATAEAVDSEEPDVTFEDLYGISEAEFNAMSTDEKDEFLKKHYS
ncbi:efflux RND transporter periplasmic adaptor subunit [Ruminococcus albus]|uniref:HlyD family secretion protein n=1 Tax=Ruminococcus albus TaxID=1264 RepID=A0A1I1HDP2_RUMAL|nr:efflux RND transporter periplasmic adaptor subunit [Ruminococcus albus]SFC21971.1 HlyD family secretion protein [Ruminococcus albus]